MLKTRLACVFAICAGLLLSAQSPPFPGRFPSGCLLIGGRWMLAALRQPSHGTRPMVLGNTNNTKQRHSDARRVVARRAEVPRRTTTHAGRPLTRSVLKCMTGVLFCIANPLDSRSYKGLLQVSQPDKSLLAKNGTSRSESRSGTGLGVGNDCHLMPATLKWSASTLGRN